MKLQHVPNAITISRFLLIPVLFLVLKDSQYTAALGVFFIAGVSDVLDGYVARRFNVQSQLGAVLDPLADKALLITTYVMLAFLNLVPFWLMVAIVFRDIFIVGVVLGITSSQGPIRMNPSLLSKLNTFSQIALVLGILLQQSLAWQGQGVIDVALYFVLFTTVSSFVHYLWIWLVKKEITSIPDQKGN